MRTKFINSAQSRISPFHSHTHSGYSSRPLADFLPTCRAQAAELWDKHLRSQTDLTNLSYFRIITKTGMQSLIQHSMSQIVPNLKNGNSSGKSEGETETSLSAASATAAVGSLTCLQEKFDPTSYRSVHNLATNTDKRNFEDLIKKTAEAIFMARCLKFNGFFGNGEDDHSEETRKAEIFISSLLLRHLQIASTNGLEMAECLLKNNDVTKFDIIPVGGAIFPTMSFFNHSCYPNALRLGYQGFQVLLFFTAGSAKQIVTLSFFDVSQPFLKNGRFEHYGPIFNFNTFW